jgi:hypothetical protein
MPHHDGSPQAMHIQQQQQQQQHNDAGTNHRDASGHEQSPEAAEQQQQQQPVKRRGRPLGSKNKATLAKAGTAGPLMTHVMHVQQGEVRLCVYRSMCYRRGASVCVPQHVGQLLDELLVPRQCEQQGQHKL